MPNVQNAKHNIAKFLSDRCRTTVFQY